MRGPNDVAAEPRPCRSTVGGRSPQPRASYAWSGPVAVGSQRLRTPRQRSVARPSRCAMGKRTWGLTTHATYARLRAAEGPPGEYKSPARPVRSRALSRVVHGPARGGREPCRWGSVVLPGVVASLVDCGPWSCQGYRAPCRWSGSSTTAVKAVMGTVQAWKVTIAIGLSRALGAPLPWAAPRHATKSSSDAPGEVVPNRLLGVAT